MYNSYSQCPYCEEQILTTDQGHMETCKLKQLQYMFHMIGCTYIGEDQQALKMHMEKDSVFEHIILLLKVIDDETFDIQEKIKVDLKRFKGVINANKKQLVVLSNQLKEMKSKIDPRIKSLQKLTASNSESIIDFKSIREQYMQAKTIQDKIRNQELRIVALEQNPGCRSSSGSGMSEALRSEIARIQEATTLQENRLIEYSMRLKAMDTTSFDGTFIWKVQGNTQYALAADNKLTRKQTLYIWDEIGPSICLIIAPGITGTGFVVGSYHKHVFILTCYHVKVQDAIRNQQSCWAEFGYLDQGEPATLKVKIAPLIFACDNKLDYILLSLEYDSQLLAFVKTNLGNLIPDQSPSDKDPLIIIGHSYGKELTLDPGVYCVPRPPCTHVPYEYIFYQCHSFDGASGAPVMSKDKRLLYAMHCGGSQPGGNSEVEHGVALSQVLRDIKRKAMGEVFRPGVHSDLFWQVAYTLFPQIIRIQI